MVSISEEEFWEIRTLRGWFEKRLLKCSERDRALTITLLGLDPFSAPPGDPTSWLVPAHPPFCLTQKITSTTIRKKKWEVVRTKEQGTSNSLPWILGTQLEDVKLRRKAGWQNWMLVPLRGWQNYNWSGSKSEDQGEFTSLYAGTTNKQTQLLPSCRGLLCAPRTSFILAMRSSSEPVCHDLSWLPCHDGLQWPFLLLFSLRRS